MVIRYHSLGDSELTRSFRLLKLIPGEQSCILHCQLYYFNIHRAPPYRAISYTWGDPFAHGEKNNRAELAPIVVNGEEVLVGKSVVSALTAMRDWHPASTDYAWADALCIDQENPRERGQQVGLMSQIYSQAESVFVWLGPSSDDSDVGIDFLLSLAIDRGKPDKRNAILARASDPANRSSWLALAAMMERRWWTRAWILQESVLARHIDFACGKRLAHGNDVMNGFSATEDFRDKLYNVLKDEQNIELPVHAGNVIDGMGRMRRARLEGILYSMPTCHYRSMSAQATDARDYVYGKLGLASDTHFVRPDYEAPVLETYRDFVTGHIQEHQSLDIIYFDARPRETPGLPSWVPDWKASYGANHLIPETPIVVANKLHAPVSARLTSDSVARLEVRNGQSRLTVDCNLIDTVDGLGAAGEAGWQGNTAPKPLSQSQHARSAYGDEGQTFEALWRTILANKDMEGNQAIPRTGSILAATTASDEVTDSKSGPRFRRYYEHMRGLKLAGMTVDDWMAWARYSLPPDSFSLAERIEAERSVVDACYFRRVATTTKGYVAVAPYETEVGDHVCLLKGSSLPVILRKPDKVGADEEEWHLVGAAFIFGIDVDAGPFEKVCLI